MCVYVYMCCAYRRWINARARVQVHAYRVRSAHWKKKRQPVVCYARKIIEPNSRKRPLRDSTARRWHRGSQPHSAARAKILSTTVFIFYLHRFRERRSTIAAEIFQVHGHARSYFFTVSFIIARGYKLKDIILKYISDIYIIPYLCNHLSS